MESWERAGCFCRFEAVKMTSEKYVEFLTDDGLPWYKKNRAFCNRIVLMHDNAPCHAVRNTSASLAAMSSPELNSTENLEKRKINSFSWI